MEIITAEDLARRVGEAAGEEVADREIRLHQTLKAHAVLAREMDAQADELRSIIVALRESLEAQQEEHLNCHTHMRMVGDAAIEIAIHWAGKAHPDASPDIVSAIVCQELRERTGMEPDPDIDQLLVSDIDLRGGI